MIEPGVFFYCAIGGSLTTCAEAPGHGAGKLDLSLLDCELLPHQSSAVAWMWRRSNGDDPWGAVFDDLGMGKTVEAIGLVCARIARAHMAEGRKVVIFSLFTSGVLDELAARFSSMGVKHHVLVGSTPVEERSSMVESFPHDDAKVFMMSRAGSEGINLQQAASVMVDLTPWWNFDQNYQAARRIYRIGQQSDVDVYRLVVSGSIEDRMLDLQDEKRTSADIVVRQPRFEITKMSREELMAILEPIGEAPLAPPGQAVLTSC